MELYTCICKDIDQMRKQRERECALALKEIASGTSHLLAQQKEMCAKKSEATEDFFRTELENSKCELARERAKAAEMCAKV